MEKRKEKSRNAARCRRTLESEIFNELYELLPIPPEKSNQLDKAAIVRLVIAYIKLKNDFIYASSLESKALNSYISLFNYQKEQIDDFCLSSLDGFILLLSEDGSIIYVSEMLSHYLGIPQLDLIGQNLYDFCHPCDHDELSETLENYLEKKNINITVNFFLRFRSTLINNGRNVNLKSATYKVMHCIGHSAYNKNNKNYMNLLVQPIINSFLNELVLTSGVFVSYHSMDMKFQDVEHFMVQFLRYKCEDLKGHSFYQFFHPFDHHIIKNFKMLYTYGEIETSCYRFLCCGGGYCWLCTKAFFQHNKYNKCEQIICIHTIVSDIQSSNECLSLVQINSNFSNYEKLEKKLFVKVDDPGRNLFWNAPQAVTSSTLAIKTEDMSKGFLVFPDDSLSSPVLKDSVEEEDLERLAPSIDDDTCIPINWSLFPNVLENNIIEVDQFEKQNYLANNTNNVLIPLKAPELQPVLILARKRDAENKYSPCPNDKYDIPPNKLLKFLQNSNTSECFIKNQGVQTDQIMCTTSTQTSKSFRDSCTSPISVCEHLLNDTSFLCQDDTVLLVDNLFYDLLQHQLKKNEVTLL